MLQNNGCLIKIFSLYPLEDDWSAKNDIEVFNYFDRPYSHVAKASKLRYPLAVYQVNKIIKTFQPEIINAHYASSYGLIGAIAKTNKFYLSFWGSDVFVFPKKSLLHKILLMWICNRSDLIFSSSQIMTKDIAHYTKKEVKTIPFGIAINSFNPKNLDTSDSKKSYKIGVIKSLEPIYRIDIAIEAIKTLNKSYPNTFDLFICGSGSLETELKKLADNNIYFLGKINQEEVPTFLYTLDIFLNTIEFESFGVSTIEAMACGLPVIAYKAGGAEEIIKHDENGILYTPNTPESLAIAIDEVVKNPQKTRQLGQNARKHIKSNYSLADIQKQIGELF